jgi:MMPL family
VIAAAAIIMISVFGSFILNGDPTIKQFGVGLSVAVLLASAMVLSLAPAMLTLFGRVVWWLPRWLSKLLPHVDIEGEAEPSTPGPAAAPQRHGTTAGRAPPDADGPAAGRIAGQTMPRTDAWPEPSTPIQETTAPGDGDGRGDHVPRRLTIAVPCGSAAGVDAGMRPRSGPHPRGLRHSASQKACS